MEEPVYNTFIWSNKQVLRVPRRTVLLFEENGYNTNPGLLHIVLTGIAREMHDVCVKDWRLAAGESKLRFTAYSEFVENLDKLSKLTNTPPRREDLDSYTKKVTRLTETMVTEFEELMRMHQFSEIVGMTDEMSWILSSFGFKTKF